MATDNLVRFPRSKREHATRSSQSRTAPRNAPARGHKGRFLMKAAGKLLLGAAWAMLLLAARPAQFFFGVLLIGFLGKLWLHWGRSDALSATLDVVLCLLVFVALWAVIALTQPAGAIATVRLSLWNRLLRVARR